MTYENLNHFGDLHSRTTQTNDAQLLPVPLMTLRFAHTHTCCSQRRAHPKNRHYLLHGPHIRSLVNILANGFLLASTGPMCAATISGSKSLASFLDARSTKLAKCLSVRLAPNLCVCVCSASALYRRCHVTASAFDIFMCIPR